MSSRADLKEYALRKLGKPVINIEADDTQLEDRIDEALQVYAEFHFDSYEEKWMSYPLTADDITNGYVTVPDSVLTVVEILPMYETAAYQGMFSYQYQVMSQELAAWRPFDQIDYFMKMTNLQEVLQLTSVTPSFEHIRHSNKLIVHADLEQLGEGYPLAIKAVYTLDPEEVTAIYTDKWLRQYTTALFKQQWGSNTKKYDQVQLLGGVTVNGQQIYEEATEEIQRLEELLEERYQEPVGLIIG